jgi:ABC-type multidrug transport system ATPase subunit
LSVSWLQVRKLIGYCPQGDALFELLTGREHLELFGRLRIVRYHNSCVLQLASRVCLRSTWPSSSTRCWTSSHSDRKATIHVCLLIPGINCRWANEISSAYSGGNKRKLCVGIALIGNPPIVFLDEPSTGMVRPCR